jgi:hypothetical protein
MDIILVLDGSGSLGWDGWAAVKGNAQKLIESFQRGVDDGKADIRVAVVLFSWGATIETHFTTPADAIEKVKSMSWPNSVTFTSSGLWMAWYEALYARWWSSKTAILLTDGWPYYWFYTWWAAWWLRWWVRLMTIPVTAWSPTWLAWEIASWPKHENYIYVPTFTQLASNAMVNTMIEDLCPKVY